jgi:hypothetical protein
MDHKLCNSEVHFKYILDDCDATIYLDFLVAMYQQHRRSSSGKAVGAFRWFVGLGIDDPAWDHSVFAKTATGCLKASLLPSSWRRS